MEKEGKIDAREGREGKSERLGQFKRKESNIETDGVILKSLCKQTK